mgnify:FL=1
MLALVNLADWSYGFAPYYMDYFYNILNIYNTFVLNVYIPCQKIVCHFLHYLIFIFIKNLFKQRCAHII